MTILEPTQVRYSLDGELQIMERQQGLLDFLEFYGNQKNTIKRPRTLLQQDLMQ